MELSDIKMFHYLCTTDSSLANQVNDVYNLCIKITDYLEKRGHLSGEDKEVITYGLFFLVFNAYCFALSIIVGFIFQLVVESIVFFFSFLFIKRYAGGYHAKKEWICLIISSLGIIAAISIIYFSRANLSLVKTILVFSAIQSTIICLLSPLEAQDRPLDKVDVKKYKKYSLIRTIIAFIVVVVLYCFNCFLLATSIIVALIFEGALIILGYIQKRNPMHI